MTESQIEWHLADLMKTRGLRNKDLAYKTALHYVTVSKLKHSKMPERIESSTLEKLCVALECNPGDLIRLKQPFPDNTDFPDELSDFSQKERLSPSKNRKGARSIDSAEDNQTFNEVVSAQQQLKLRMLSTDITGHTVKLMKLLENLLPPDTRSQVAPHLVGILEDSNQQLRMLNDVEQRYSGMMQGSEKKGLHVKERSSKFVGFV